MITRKSVISSFIWKFLERCSVQGTSFLVSIVLARILMPEEYGIIAIVLVFTNLANVIVEGGFSTALIQKQGTNNKDFSTVLLFSLLISTILYFILYFTAPIISKFYHISDLTKVLRIISFCLIFGAINSVQRAYVAKETLFNKLFLSSLYAVILSGITGILMAYKGYGVWALVWQYLLSQFLNTIILWKLINWHPSLIFDLTSFKSLYSFGWKIFMTNLMVSVFVNIRSLLIGHFFSPNSLAFFDKGKQFPSIIMENVNSSIQTILLPVLSEQQNDHNRVKEMLRRTIKTSTLFIFPLMIGLIVCSNSIIELLLTQKWIEVSTFVKIFSLAFLLMPMQIANMEAIKALGFSNVTLKLESLKKVLEVLILIVSFIGGVIGVAWGVVFYNASCLLINLYPCKRILNYGYKEQMKDIYPILIASLLMGFVTYLSGFLMANFSMLISLIIQIFIGFIFFIAICYIFKIEAFIYFFNLIKPLILKKKN